MSKKRDHDKEIVSFNGWKTSDDQSFKSEKEAKDHQNDLNLRETLRREFIIYFTGNMNKNDILDVLFKNKDQLVDLFKTYDQKGFLKKNKEWNKPK